MRPSQNLLRMLNDSIDVHAFSMRFLRDSTDQALEGHFLNLGTIGRVAIEESLLTFRSPRDLEAAISSRFRATASPVRRPNRPVNPKIAPILGPNNRIYGYTVKL